ncbi:MAG TPA: asparagine synthase (glutamine-hydrolyzing) [Chitinophagaceae bacterium]|nr:asparagine synthase (glutamine-hydrolyzing) [Chitinophagaceae bacterium]
MCGIAGILSSNPGFISTEQLKRMTDSLAHRGPDGEGNWIHSNNTIALGHRRLSIIDLTNAGNQPMHLTPSLSINGGGDVPRYTIIHNGEIYNYVELKEELKKKGYSFQSQTDTEVIVAAYDYWEEECVDHFDGMFAFAIWDEQEKELFAARDRFGEKPFFYYCDGQRFLFASEMKALWAAGIERKPNQKMIFNFITIGYVDNPNQPHETFFENIQKLPAATFLKYHLPTKELIFEKYWDIDLEKQQENITDTEALEKFNHLFINSVKRRLRSDVAIATSLSGGLDSSSIVATINKLQASNSELRTSNLKPQTFTTIFPGFEKDESVFSKQVSDQFSLQQYTVNVSADELMNDWEKLLYHQEEPFGSASVYAQYKVFELAKQHDVKVLLDGQGADETIAGYHKYYKWYWQELFHKRKLLGSKELKAAKEIGVQEKFDFKNIIASLFPDLASVILERQYLVKALRQEDLNKEFVRLQSREAYYTTPTYFNLNGNLYFNTCIHGLEELLRYADRNSMAHGREVRLPFLSHELVEFIFSLPSNFKIRNGRTKWLLRKAMEKGLPSQITWRQDKIGFEPPQKDWMQNHRVQDAIHEAKRKLISEKILKPQSLDKPVQALSSHEADNFDWRYLTVADILK